MACGYRGSTCAKGPDARVDNDHSRQQPTNQQYANRALDQRSSADIVLLRPEELLGDLPIFGSMFLLLVHGTRRYAQRISRSAQTARCAPLALIPQL